MDYHELITDTTEMNLTAIADMFQVQYQTARMWRRDCLAVVRELVNDDRVDVAKLTRAEAEKLGYQPHPNQLPMPEFIKFNLAVWTAGPVRLWGMQTGRMTETGVPQLAKPPGRPRRRAA